MIRLRPPFAVLALLALLLVSSARAFAEEPTVSAELSGSSVYLGDDVTLTIVVNDSDKAEPPPLAAFGVDFDVDYVGGRNASEHSTIVANGVVRESRTLRYLMQYRLRPQKSGRVTVPELNVGVNGKTLTTSALSLDVIAPRPSRVAELQLHVTPERPYVDQAVTLELEARVRAFEFKGGWISERDPWTRATPSLTIPWFRELDGLETGDFSTWAQELLKGSEGGFSINGIRDSSFFSSGLLTFHLPAEVVEEDGVPWRVYRLRKTFRATRAGTFDVPLSALRGTFITRAVGGASPEKVDAEEVVFVTHDPRRLEVRPVPKQGRPATYTHAVGRFRVETSIEPARVKVGDPVTLSVRVWGEGRVESVLAPALERQESLTRDFVVGDSPALIDSDGTTKVFTCTIRPRAADVTEVPPVELAYFDPEAEAFDVATSRALPIAVEKVTTVGSGDMVDAGGDARRVTSPGEEQTGGLLANRPAADLLRDERPSPRGAESDWIVLLGAPLAYGILAVVSARRRRRLADPLGLRAARAAETARTEIAAASAETDQLKSAGALHQALAGFVAARARRPAGGMTADDVGRLFAERGVEAPAAASLVKALRLCETVRFGGGDGTALRAALTAAPDWIAALERESLT